MEKPSLSSGFSGIVPSICDAEAGDAECVRLLSRSTGEGGPTDLSRPGTRYPGDRLFSWPMRSLRRALDGVRPS